MQFPSSGRSATKPEAEAWRKERAELRRELREARETIRAIRDGRVDAFVVGGNAENRVYALESADGLYRVLVERMQQCAVTVSPDSTVLYANSRSSTLLGRSPAELVGCPFRPFVAEADRRQFDAVIKGEAEFEGEIWLTRADGVLVPVYLTAAARSAEEGGGACLLITDLTRQKQHEELIAAENLARSMLEQAADAVVVCDPGGRVAFASPAAHELCGFNPLGQRFTELFPLSVADGTQSSGVEKFSLDTLDTPIRGLEATLSCSNTQPANVLLSAGLVKDSNGSALGSVITLADITALKNAELELRDADHQKDEFLAVLAHELRNPLAPIVTGLELLEVAGDKSSTSGRALQMMKRQVEHLTRLVDDLLEISRITLGKIELRKEVVDFADVLASALDSTRPHTTALQHSVRIDVPPRPVQVEADAVRLSQVLANLLNNAAKYTPAGGDIQLTCRVEGDELVVSVRDSGCGIAPESLDDVFTMFAQPRRSERSQDGLGVGLALVRRIVEMHGGSVSATSEGIGKGSQFTLRLPLGDVTATAPAEGTISRESTGRRKRVLVVDDNEDSANSLGMLLEIMECEVKVAFNGEAALELLEHFHPDLVFLDLDMPHMDGYEVSRRIRRHSEVKDTTLVALTGWGQEKDRRMVCEAGFNRHLLKPIDAKALRAVLAKRH